MATITALLAAAHAAGVGVKPLAKTAGVAPSTAYDRLNGRTREDGEDTLAALVAAAEAMGVVVPTEPWALVESARPVRRHHPQPVHQAAAQAAISPEEPEMIPTKLVLDQEALSHWKLPASPFRALAAGKTWMSRRLQSVENGLTYAIENRQIVALVGGVGMGKTTLLRRLDHQMSLLAGRVIWMSPGNLDRAEVSYGALISTMLRDLGVMDFGGWSAEKRGDELRRIVSERAQQGDYPCLVIDESHDLAGAGLIALKRIWDSFRFGPSFAVLLVGQTPLAMRLQTDRALRELAGRTMLLEIPELTPEEGLDYLGWRFQAVGATAPFDKAAVAALLRRVPASEAGPLWLDALAIRALRYGHRMGATTVDADIANRC